MRTLLHGVSKYVLLRMPEPSRLLQESVAINQGADGMGFLQAVESSGIATFVRESPSLLGYTLVLSLHAMGLAVVVGLSGALALRLLGFAPGIPLAPLRALFPFMYLGFWVNAGSGLALLAANATGLATNVMFLIKLAFVAAAVIVLRLLRRRLFADSEQVESGVASPPIKRLAALSLVLWGCAVIAGRLTSYPWLVETYFGF